MSHFRLVIVTLGVVAVFPISGLGQGRAEVAGGPLTGPPVGYLGNGRPLDIVDERWESTELHLVIESRYSDPRFGLVEYGLTHIRRGEPPSDLFVVPDDYNNNAPADEPWLDFIPFDGFLSGRAVIPPSTKPSHK